MHPRELQARQVVFDAIAKALPTMGRDFQVNMTCVMDGDLVKTDLQITPLTDLGKAIMPFLEARMKQVVAEVIKERTSP